MKILIDTNILIDYILERQPFTDSAEKIMILCKDKKIDGYIAVHSLINIFYILRKQMTVEERMLVEEMRNLAGGDLNTSQVNSFLKCLMMLVLFAVRY